MTSRRLRACVVFLVLLGCQNGDGTPSAAPGAGEQEQTLAGCVVRPDTLDFGRVLTPPFGWEEDYVTMPFTIRNSGDSLLKGRISVDVKPTGPRRARFALTPAEVNPEFSILPGDSATFVLGVTMENASHGDYSGTIGLGSDCEDIPIRLIAVPSQ